MPGWTDVAARRPGNKLDTCYGIGSQLEVELVPTLLLAARLGRRLAFSERNWSYLADRNAPPSHVWNYGCDHMPEQNDVFGLHPDPSLASRGGLGAGLGGSGGGSGGSSALARSAFAKVDALTVSWGSTRRTSMDWSCIVQARHPLAAKPAAKATRGLVKISSRVS